MIEATFRPLPMWPHRATPADSRRSRSTFRASWSNTLNLLDREIHQLAGRAVIIAAGFAESDLHLDGWPRSGAKELPAA